MQGLGFQLRGQGARANAHLEQKGVTLRRLHPDSNPDPQPESRAALTRPSDAPRPLAPLEESLTLTVTLTLPLTLTLTPTPTPTLTLVPLRSKV